MLNECPGYNTKANGDAPIMLKFWGMQSTSSLLSLSGPLWSSVVATDRVLSLGQIELFDIQTECKQMTWAKLKCLK